jgi:hypothetical protein
MRTNAITMTMLTVTHLIDRRVAMTVDQVRQYISDGSLFEAIEQCHAEDVVLSSVFRLFFEGEQELILSAIAGVADVTLPEELGVSNRENGFLYVNALLIQVLQQGTTEVDVESVD